jgi:hypothetical protein
MWPFKRRRDEAQLRDEATRRLADEVADELVRNPRPPRIGLFPAQVRFILLQVRDEPVEPAAATIAKAIDLIERRDGMVTDVMSSMVLAVFGLPESEDAEKAHDQQAKSVARLAAELGPEVRLVHGAADGLIGTFGSPQHMHYGPLLPGFERHLGALLALEFGQSAEVPTAI